MFGRFFLSIALLGFCVLNGLAYAGATWLIFANLMRACGQSMDTPSGNYPFAFFSVVAFLFGCGIAWGRLNYVRVTTAGGASFWQLCKSTLVLLSLPVLVLLVSAIGERIARFVFLSPDRWEYYTQILLAGQAVGAACGLGLYLVFRMTFDRTPFKERPEPYDR